MKTIGFMYYEIYCWLDGVQILICTLVLKLLVVISSLAKTISCYKTQLLPKQKKVDKQQKTK